MDSLETKILIDFLIILTILVFKALTLPTPLHVGQTIAFALCEKPRPSALWKKKMLHTLIKLYKGEQETDFLTNYYRQRCKLEQQFKY